MLGSLKNAFVGALKLQTFSYILKFEGVGWYFSGRKKDRYVNEEIQGVPELCAKKCSLSENS